MILLIGAVFDGLRRIESPESLGMNFSCCSHGDNMSRFYGPYIFVGCKPRNWTKTHRARDVFFVDLRRTVLQRKQRRSLSRPDNTIAIEVILESACASYITDEIKC